MKNLKHNLVFLISVIIVAGFFLVSQKQDVAEGQGCVPLGGAGCSLNSDCCSGDCFLCETDNRCCVPKTRSSCTCGQADINNDGIVDILDLVICGYSSSCSCSDYDCLTCSAAWFGATCPSGGGGGGGNSCNIDTCLSFRPDSEYFGCSDCSVGDSRTAYFLSPDCGGSYCYCCDRRRAACGIVAVPDSGIAPLAVNFFIAANSDTNYWRLTFGDGQTYYDPAMCHALYLICSGNPNEKIIEHNYATPGNYTGKLEGWNVDPYATSPQCISQVPIVVTSGSVGSIRVAHPSGPGGIIKLNLISATDAIAKGYGLVKVAKTAGDINTAADLVPTTDPNASPVRIKMPDGNIRAWAKLP